MNDSREVVGWALIAAAVAFCALVDEKQTHHESRRRAAPLRPR